MRRRRESLKQRLRIIERDGLNCGLDGCPVGGWPETERAKRNLLDVLPSREERTYTLGELIEALYTVDHAERYRVREVSK